MPQAEKAAIHNTVEQPEQITRRINAKYPCRGEKTPVCLRTAFVFPPQRLFLCEQPLNGRNKLCLHWKHPLSRAHKGCFHGNCRCRERTSVVRIQTAVVAGNQGAFALELPLCRANKVVAGPDTLAGRPSSPDDAGNRPSRPEHHPQAETSNSTAAVVRDLSKVQSRHPVRSVEASR